MKVKNISFTKEDLSKLAKESHSKADLIKRLGGNPSNGGWYRQINRFIRIWEIDTSHFLGQSWAKGKKVDQSFKRKSHDEIFVENSTFCEPKTVILRDKLLDYRCSSCNIENSWNDKPLTLQLDHINGISNDNRLENLRFLCPNCHSQTETWSRRNKKY